MSHRREFQAKVIKSTKNRHPAGGHPLDEICTNKRKPYSTVFSAIIGLILTFGCGDKKDANKSVYRPGDEMPEIYQPIKVDEPSPGKIRDTISCSVNPANSYAIFLPAAYAKEKNWPVIFFFDPHAKGNLPLKKYKGLAEKFQYVLIGSNNIQNGMSMYQVEQIAEEIFSDASERYSLDNRRTYLCGFSGGARVAVHLAKQYPHIAGVIHCGAGSGESAQIQRSGFFTIGFAGDEDFNYTEMKNLDLQMEGLPVSHDLITFEGKHEWPDSLVFANGFIRLELDGMRRQIIPQNDSLINAIKQKCDEDISLEKKSGNMLSQVELYERCAEWLEGFINVDSFINIVSVLKADRHYQNLKQEEISMLHNEMQLQQGYLKHLGDKNIEWWRNESRRLQSNATAVRRISNGQRTNLPEIVIKRLLGYLSLGAYMHAVHFLGKNDLATAEHYIIVYGLVDPTNPEPYYLAACINARRGDNGNTIGNLKKAVVAGFDDIKRMEADSNFVAQRNKQEFVDVTNGLKE